jgi:hypothetical protein
MRHSTRKAIFAALIGAWLPAQAVIVEIEPDSWAAGADISRLTPGVTLSVITMEQTGVDQSTGLPIWSPIHGGAVYSRAGGATIGGNRFGWSPDAPAGWGFGEILTPCFDAPCTYGNAGPRIGHVMRVDFDTPTDYFSVIGRYSGGGGTELSTNVGGCREYNLNLVGTCLTRYSGDPVNPLHGWGVLTVQSQTANISYAYIGGFLLPGQADRIQFNMVSVPEPGPLALFLIAGVLLAGRGWLRTASHRASPMVRHRGLG